MREAGLRLSDAEAPIAGGDAEFSLNADDRGGAGPNGKESFTVAEAGAQITRGGQTWNGVGVLGQAASVTYAFRDTAPALMPNGTGGFSRFNATQITQAELALQSWSDVANIVFTRVGGSGYSDSAQMLFGNYSSGAPNAAAFAYLPPGSGSAGDTWYNSTFSYNTAPAITNYGRTVLTHEIGHAIGLKHPGDYNAGNGSPTYENSAVYYEDSRQYTVMSYWSESKTGGAFGNMYAAAPLLDDIAAVQRLYGANMTTRTGDTVYGFNATAGRDFYSAASASTKLVFAVWDAGGIDRFDFSGYAQTQQIDLRAGFFSNVGGLVGNVSIAMGVVIEQAYGGSGVDTLIGNAADNLLRGGGGGDALYGGDGSDTLLGDAGDDFISGEDGANNLSGDDGNDVLVGGGRNDQVSGGVGNDQIYSGAGSDWADGGDGSDFVRGMDGDDVLQGGEAADTVWGETGDDLVIGGGGDDALSGGSGHDQVYAGFGADSVDGGAGDDFLRGLDGADVIHGGEGLDTLVGDEGADFLYGDADADVFLYLTPSDSVIGAADVVFDFTSGVDRFDFRPITGGVAASWALLPAGGGYTALDIDIGNDGTTDLRIVLTPGHTVTASDLLF